jgi:hypothetical protein
MSFAQMSHGSEMVWQGTGQDMSKPLNIVVRQAVILAQRKRSRSKAAA